MFTYKIEPIVSNGVATIGGKYLIPKGICKDRWSCTNDDTQMHTNKFNDLLYFTSLPVNIISANALAESMNDEEGTWLLTKIKYYICTWYFGRYKNTIAHSEKKIRIRDPS